MALKSKRVSIAKGINLNIINTEKFESNALSIYFILPLDRKQVTKNALLPFVLKISQRLEGLHGLNLSIEIDKKGEKQIIRFTIEMLKMPCIGDEKHILDNINLLKSIIFNPYLEEDIFSPEHVEEGKKTLKKLIAKKKKDIKDYSIQRCIEEMYKNERYSISPLGYIEDLYNINNIILYKHYINILAQAPMEIFFIGECKGYIEDCLKKNFKFKKNDIYIIEREYITGNIQTKNMVYEDMGIDENRLVLGYRTGIPYESPLYNGLLVVNSILEYGVKSILLEKAIKSNKFHDLINSNIYKYKSFILIDCDVSAMDFEEVLKKCRNQVDEMKEGKFTQGDTRIAKEFINKSIESIKESHILISDFFLDKVLTNDNRSYNEVLVDIDKVTKEEIIEVSNKLTLDTIYLLRSFEISLK